MGLIQNLIDLISDSSKKDEKTPENLCPNCWGRQEYGGKFYDAALNHGVNHFDHDPKAGWVKEYADKNLSSITLKKNEEGLVCPNCKITYRESD